MKFELSITIFLPILQYLLFISLLAGNKFYRFFSIARQAIQIRKPNSSKNINRAKCHQPWKPDKIRLYKIE
jgi:hypothetical protein